MSLYVQCRLCADYKFTNEVIHIKKNEAVKMNLEHKIQQCLNLHFNDTRLPKNICSLCCDKVTAAYDFQELVKEAQDRLEEAVEDCETKIKEEISDTELNSYDYVEPFLPEDDYFKIKDDSDERTDTETKEKIKDSTKSGVKRKCKIRKTNFHNSDRVKRKYVKRDQKIKKESDPEYERQKAERNEMIRRIKDEWKTYKWKCVVCENELTGLEQFRKHFEEAHNQPPKYNCMECSKVFESYYNFKRHMSAHRNKFKYKCDQCGRFFHRRKLLRNHSRSHSSEKNFICPTCGKSYKNSNSLRVHLRKHMAIVPVVSRPKYECELCHKTLHTQSGLKNHHKIHKGERDFTCDQCGKTFLTNCSLKYHLNTVHSDLKPFCCEHCQRTFKTQQLLKVHLQVHSDEKRHACEVCGRRFHRKGTLIRHSSVHTGILAFCCEYCYKRFRTKQLLKVHTRQHTGERPYSCLECNHHFTDSSNYVKHMKGKHGVLSTRKNATYRTDPPPLTVQQVKLTTQTMNTINSVDTIVDYKQE